MPYIMTVLLLKHINMTTKEIIEGRRLASAGGAGTYFDVDVDIETMGS